MSSLPKLQLIGVQNSSAEKRRIIMRVLCVLLASLLWASLVSFAQAPNKSMTGDVRIPLNGFFRWDDAMNEVVVYRDQHSRSEIPLEVYDIRTGAKRTIDILKDFPQSSQVYVSNIAVANDGGIVVVCRLQSSSAGSIKELILSYGPSLTLDKIWDVAPYEPAAVAIDEQGNVYSVGTRYDEKTAGQSYPLLVVYDSEGRVEKEMLSRSTFPSDVDPVRDTHQMGFVTMRVTNTRIFLYLPSVHDALALDKDGKILKQVDAYEVYRQLTREKGYMSFFVRDDYFSSVGELWSGLIIRAPSASSEKTAGYASVIVKLTEAGQAEVQNAEEDHFSMRLAGVTPSNEPVILHIDAPKSGVLTGTR
jgi:hypothetical protein